MIRSDDSYKTGVGQIAEPSRAPRLWRLLRLALVIAMLLGLIVVAEPKKLWATLSKASWPWIVAAIPFGLVASFLDAAKLHYLMRPHGFRGGCGAVLRTNLVVNFVSLFLPGTVGGAAVAWYRLSRPQALGVQTAVALSVNAVLKLVVICTTAAAALALDRNVAAQPGLTRVLLALGVLPLLSVAALTWTDAAGLIGRLGYFQRCIPGRVRSVLSRLLESVHAYSGDRSTLLLALASGFGRKLIENFCFLFALRSVGADPGYATVLWIMGAVEVAGMIPVTFAGLGLPQVTHVGLLATVGVETGQAVAANIVSWASLLPVYLAGAAILLLESLPGRKTGTINQPGAR